MAALTMMCAMTVTTLFTACGDDGENAPVGTPTKAEMNCTLETNAQTLERFDFLAKFYDANGKIVQEEPVVWKDGTNDDGVAIKVWSKTVSASLPSKLGMYVQVLPHEDIDKTVQQLFAFGYSCIFTSYNSLDQVIDSSPLLSYGSESAISAGKFDEWLNDLSIRINKVYSFDEKGRITESAW